VLYMLDTDICSYIMRKAPHSLLSLLQKKTESGHSICISVISYSELRLGAERSAATEKYNQLIDELSERLDFIADWTTNEADCFAMLQSALFLAGKPIGHNDTMIAAHALSLDAILVSNNQRHFSQVPNLLLENWSQ